jgi:hypothetical protein
VECSISKADLIEYGPNFQTTSMFSMLRELTADEMRFGCEDLRPRAASIILAEVVHEHHARVVFIHLRVEHVAAVRGNGHTIV